MWIILWILFGAVVGWLASILTGKNSRMGLVANIIVGLLGSLVGGWISTLVGLGGSYETFSLSSLLFSILGAVILLLLFGFFFNRRRRY